MATRAASAALCITSKLTSSINNDLLQPFHTHECSGAFRTKHPELAGAAVDVGLLRAPDLNRLCLCQYYGRTSLCQVRRCGQGQSRGNRGLHGVSSKDPASDAVNYTTARQEHKNP